jgi:hypothetical protein
VTVEERDVLFEKGIVICPRSIYAFLFNAEQQEKSHENTSDYYARH